MYLLYTDASGTPELQDHSKEYTLVGVALPESAWQAFDRRIIEVKQKYGLVQTKAELHAKDFCISFNEQNDVDEFESLAWNERRAAVVDIRKVKLATYSEAKRKEKRAYFQRTLPYIHLSRAERSALLGEVLDAVGGFAEVRLFSEVIRKSDAKDDIVGQAFAQVVSRFDSFLERQNFTARKSLERLQQQHPHANRLDAAQEAYVHKGLIIMDNEPSRETAYRAMLSGFRESGHPWGNLKHVIEAPFFVDSVLSPAVQVADICAYAVRRYIERASAEGSPEQTNFSRIFHLFDRGGNKLHGIRHACLKATCTCLVCKERGHAPS